MSHRPFLPQVLGLCLALLPCIAVAEPPAPRYTVTDLGTLGGTTSTASAVNAKGQVIGVSGAGQHKQDALDVHAFIWNGGTMTAVIIPQMDLLSFSYGINGLGDVVGLALMHTASGPSGRADNYVSYLWRQGQVTLLPMLNAVGINDSGQIVGQSLTALAQIGLRQSNGAMSVLAPLKGYSGSTARSLNNSGWVAGVSNGGHSVGGGRAASPRATLWKDGKAYDLGSYGSEAEGVNDAGEVVGFASGRDGSGGSRRSGGCWAFVWKEGRLRWLLGGQTFSRAQSINDQGQVVGWTGRGSGQETVAVLWRSGRMYVLNGLIGPNSGWDLTEAASINSRGQIVGTGLHHGQQRAFLLTPAPTPS